MKELIETQNVQRDLSNYKAQPKPCKTCPFAGETPIQLTPERTQEIYTYVANFESQHLCHSANNLMICRGGRDIQIEIAYALKWIDEPTNENFEKTMREINNTVI